MASNLPNTEEIYEQAGEFSTQSQHDEFTEHEVDPNAPTQMIDNDRSFKDQVNIPKRQMSCSFPRDGNKKFY